jgi:hypothetical protein
MELEQFPNRHAGETVCILGGAPSLPRDLRQIPDECRLIGLNQHALILPLDYCFFADPRVWYVVQQYQVNVITPYAVIREREDTLFTSTCPNVGLSGPMATWCAGFLGFEEIIVMGCDAYQDDRRYWHSLERHGVMGQDCTPWLTVRDQMDRPERVRFTDKELNRLWHSKSN